MTLWRLVFREIRLRRLNFILGVASVATAAGLIVAHLCLLAVHDESTRRILAEKEARTKEEMRVLQDDYRKIMKKLGFNLLLLPEGQKLDEFYADGFAARDMPEESVHKLAESGIMTIRHLLPGLEGKVRWPEQGQRTIIITGVRGEVPMKNRASLEPLMIAIPPGKAVVGHEIRHSLGLAVGDRITLMGKEFEVGRCNEERGTREDITLWIDLAAAQELLGKPGRINAILALKCHCAGSEPQKIRDEIGGILPGVQVIELRNRVTTRAEARDRARAAAVRSLDEERANRARLRAAREEFAAWLIPLVLLAAVIWVGLLSLMNVRERRYEIGLLRAVGLSRRQIATLFLGRALLMGLAGASAGYALGFGVGLFTGGFGVGPSTAAALFEPLLFGFLLLAAPLVAALASLVPALAAARHDPALVLKEE